MAEYIEREKAFKLIKEQREKETGAYTRGKNKGILIAGSIINNKELLPTADVVEVVRCKDCTYWQRYIGFIDSPNGYCFYHCEDTNQYDFCSYGENALKERESR